MRFKPSPKNKKTIDDLMLRTINKSIKNSTEVLKPILKKSINETIREFSPKFIPDQEQAEQLGIGDAGQIDTNRTENAWRNLLAGKGITTISIETRSTSLANIININVSINEEEFLSLPGSIITTESKVLPLIPWMEWFLKGKTITGTKYSTKRQSAFSRTGGGIMIEGGVWNFAPQGAGIFKSLILSINSDMSKTLSKKLAEAFNAGSK